MLAADRDDMVVKALSLALRELAKHDPQAVVEFLESDSDALAARVLREVRNNLTTGLKEPAKAMNPDPPEKVAPWWLLPDMEARHGLASAGGCGDVAATSIRK